MFVRYFAGTSERKNTMSMEEMEIDWKGELEYHARIELARFHIDESKYDLVRVDRDDGHSIAGFIGVGNPKDCPEATVIYTAKEGGLDARVELSFRNESEK